MTVSASPGLSLSASQGATSEIPMSKHRIEIFDPEMVLNIK
jgi:hypothetical protein